MLTDYYRSKLTSKLQDMRGETAMYYKNMVTGDAFSYHSADVLQPASVIKLPIFLSYLKAAASGSIDLKEELICRDEDRLGGCGALKAFHGPQRVSIETLLELMITISDNTATNMLIKRYGREELNSDFTAMGLKQTRINRLLFDSEATSKGIENAVSASDMALLLEKIYKRTFVNVRTSEYAEKILFKQQINHKIPGYIGRYAVPTAHKTGEDDGITNDVALVYARQPFILCFLSTHTDVPEFERFIRQTAYELFMECGGAL